MNETGTFYSPAQKKIHFMIYKMPRPNRWARMKIILTTNPELSQWNIFFCNSGEWRSWYCKQTHFILGQLSVLLIQNKHTYANSIAFLFAKGTIRSLWCVIALRTSVWSLSLASFRYLRTHLCCRSAKFSLATNTIVQIWHSPGDGGDDAADDMHLIELYGRNSMKGTFSVIISRTPITSTRQPPSRATKRDENRPFNIYLPQHNLYVAHWEWKKL